MGTVPASWRRVGLKSLCRWSVSAPYVLSALDTRLLSSLRPTQGAVSWSSALGPGVAGPQYLYLLRTPSSGQVEREGDYEMLNYCELNHPVNRRAECDMLFRHRWNSALKFFIRFFPRGGLCAVTNEGPALYSVEGGRGNPKRSQSLGCGKSEVGSGAGSCSQERGRLPPSAGRGNCKAFPARPPRPGPRLVKGHKKVSSVDGKLNFYSKTETFRKRWKSSSYSSSQTRVSKLGPSLRNLYSS